MALLRWELKKIWRPSLVLAIALIGAIFYQVRTGFYLEYFNRGSNWGAAQVQLAYGWLEIYGNAIEPEERPGLDDQLAELKAEFAGQVAQIPGTAEAGITDYESYGAWAEIYNASTWSDEANALDWAIYENTNRVMLGSLVEFMEEYDFLSGGGSILDWGGGISEDSPAHQASVRRIERAEAQGVYGFLPSSVMENTDEFFHYFAIWCAFSGVLLISPTLVRDALRRTRAMQWTSRRGRRVLGAERSDGSGPVVRAAAYMAQLRGLPGAVSLHRGDEILELSDGQCVEGELPLVRLDLWPVPAGPAGADLRTQFGGLRLYCGPLPVQRQLCGYAPQSHSPNRGAGLGTGALGHDGSGTVFQRSGPADWPAGDRVCLRGAGRPGGAGAVRLDLPAAAAAGLDGLNA